MMFGNRGLLQNSSLFGTKTVKKKLMIVIGLKQDNYSREMLLRYLNLVVAPGESVLAVHVEEPIDTFDPNTFHIHEDLCKSKQVDYQVKVCTGESFVAVLVQQVGLHHATMLVIGCSSPRPKESVVSSFVERLPPSCSLLVIDTRGNILLEKQGTSQQGYSCQPYKPTMIQNYHIEQSETKLDCLNSATFASRSSYLPRRERCNRENVVKGKLQLPKSKLQKQFQKLALLEGNGASRQFTPLELELATDKFSTQMVISEDTDNKMYSAKLRSGQAAAVKVLHSTKWSGKNLLQEIEILSGLKHENIVRLTGYCYTTDMHAIVYNLVKKNLKQNLLQLRWDERRGVAIGTAKALEFLHSCSPPVIHGDVRSSNILLSGCSQPLLSGFGAAIVHHQHPTHTKSKKPIYAVETSTYLAPEYLMFGKVDVKIDVYSYGVVLLELITGKEATQDLASEHGSLVLQARSLLSRGLCEHLIDPHLNEDYDREEMQRMIMAARLCIMHSSSRRPTMKTAGYHAKSLMQIHGFVPYLHLDICILQLLEEEEYWLRVKTEREKFINKVKSKDEI